MVDNKDTIAAIATPAGNGGIGVIRVSGPSSFSIAESVSNKLPRAKQADYCSFKNTENETIDTGILLCFEKPFSFTGEDVVEFQCHGGAVVLRMLLQDVLTLGARQARPGEFSERAYLNGKIDLLQAEAVADLIGSSSEQAARSAVRSLQGVFSRQLNELTEKLNLLRVQIEGSLDFSEEEIDLDKKGFVESLKECAEIISEIRVKAEKGRVLRQGLRLAIAGPPNAGKSSLLNALCGSDRAIVTPTAGTTRDTIEESLILSGVNINVVDTAGLRITDDKIEKKGVQRAGVAIEQSDVVLWLESAVEPESINAGDFIPSGKKVLRVYNKTDLLEKLPEQQEADSLYISVKTTQGLDELEERIIKMTEMAGAGEDVLLARERHLRALEETAKNISAAIKKLKMPGGALELVAEDLLQSQNALGTITGTRTADDLLGEIFSSFCIGK